MNKWYESRCKRFDGREELSYEDLYESYFSGLNVSKECVKDALNLLEEFYEVPVGKFRPDDKLEKFFDEPPKSKNFIRTFLDSILSSIAESDIEDVLEQRMRDFGTWENWKVVFYRDFESFSLEEYVLAYCGRLPKTDLCFDQ